jgi:hypothetical protein
MELLKALDKGGTAVIVLTFFLTVAGVVIATLYSKNRNLMLPAICIFIVCLFLIIPVAVVPSLTAQQERRNVDLVNVINYVQQHYQGGTAEPGKANILDVCKEILEPDDQMAHEKRPLAVSPFERRRRATGVLELALQDLDNKEQKESCKIVLRILEADDSSPTGHELSEINSAGDFAKDPANLLLDFGVLLAGSVGGFLSVLYAWLVKKELPRNIPMGLLCSAIAGALAAPIGVFVLANSDTSDFRRCLIFAGICGFSWRSILEQASALINKSAGFVPDTDKMVKAITSASSEAELIKQIDDGKNKVIQAITSAFGDSVDAELRRKSKAAASEYLTAIVQSLKTLNPSYPPQASQKSLDAFSELGIVALRTADPNLLDVIITKYIRDIGEANAAVLKVSAKIAINNIMADANISKISPQKQQEWRNFVSNW